MFLEEISLIELANIIIALELQEGMSYDEIFKYLKQKYVIPFDDERLHFFMQEVLDAD